MKNITETPIEQVSGIRGTMRSMARCGLITPETQMQAGLVYRDGADGPRRLFFGTQTDPTSMANFAELKLAGIATPVEVSGYFKYQRNAQGETYLDDSALFVENVAAIS